MPTIIKARVACSAPEVVRGRKTSNTEVDTARERFFFCLFHEAEQKGLCVLYCKNSKRFCKLHQTSWLSLNFVKFKENSSWNRNPGDTQERRHTKDHPAHFIHCMWRPTPTSPSSSVRGPPPHPINLSRGEAPLPLPRLPCPPRTSLCQFRPSLPGPNKQTRPAGIHRRRERRRGYKTETIRGIVQTKEHEDVQSSVLLFAFPPASGVCH